MIFSSCRSLSAHPSSREQSLINLKGVICYSVSGKPNVRVVRGQPNQVVALMRSNYYRMGHLVCRTDIPRRRARISGTRARVNTPRRSKRGLTRPDRRRPLSSFVGTAMRALAHGRRPVRLRRTCGTRNPPVEYYSLLWRSSRSTRESEPRARQKGEFPCSSRVCPEKRTHFFRRYAHDLKQLLRIQINKELDVGIFFYIIRKTQRKKLCIYS